MSERLSRLADAVQRRVARSHAFVVGALKLRNQLDAVIRYSRCQTSDPRQNGEAWLAGLVAPSANRIVDVGANVGTWAATVLPMATDQCRVYCYEPSPSAFLRLTERMANEARVISIAGAAGAHEGTIDLYDAGDANEHTSTVRTPELATAHVRPVTVVRLDLDLARRGWDHIDFLKVDTEGYDLHVLLGASSLLERQRIAIVQFEYNDMWRFAGSTLGHAAALLRGWSYETFLLAPNSLKPVDYERFGDYFGYSNYVAIAPEYLDRFLPLVER